MLLPHMIRQSQRALVHAYTVVNPATLWPYLSSMQQRTWGSQSADPTRGPNTCLYRTVLRRVDDLRRCDVWTPDAFDGRVWTALRATGVSRHSSVRVLGRRTVQSVAILCDVVRSGKGPEGSDWECTFWYALSFSCFFPGGNVVRLMECL